jgi:O-antigen ligase
MGMTTVVWGVVCIVLYVSSLIDVPRLVGLGPVSGLGMLTLFYNCWAWLLWWLAPIFNRRLLSATCCLGLYFAWGCLSLAWCPAVLVGLQNLAVISAFLGIMLLCARESRRSRWFRSDVQKALVRSTGVSTALYCFGLATADFGSASLLGSRAFALFALLGLAYLLGAWRYGSRRCLLWAVLITALIGFGLSRMAFVIALILFPLAQRPSRGMREFARVSSWLVLVVAVGYCAITYIEPLHERFFSGDMSLDIGGITLNASGRTTFWKATMDSYWRSWLWGNGAGSSQVLMQNTFVSIDHPHSDYVRILHDCGLIGLILWLLGMGALLWHVRRAWVRADRLNSRDAALHLSAFLILVVVICAMLSDNAMVYIYLMGPAGAFVGTSLGARPLGTHAGRNRDSHAIVRA